MPGDPLGIANHGQQMAGRQGFLAVVTDTDLFWQEKGISNCPTELVAALGLGTPVNAAVPGDLIGGTVNSARWFVIEQAIDLLVENKLTDHPASVMRVPR